MRYSLVRGLQLAAKAGFHKCSGGSNAAPTFEKRPVYAPSERHDLDPAFVWVEVSVGAIRQNTLRSGNPPRQVRTTVWGVLLLLLRGLR